MPTDQGQAEAVSARELYRVDDAALAERLGFATPAEPETPVTPVVPPAAATPDPTPEAAATAADSGEATTNLVADALKEGEADPEPEPEPEAPKPTRQLVTKFQLHDDKQELEIPEELYITFKANGKDYEKVPLDKVVQIAQMGVYNHDREQSLKAEKAQAEAAQAEAQKLRQMVQFYEQQYERVFTDDEFAEIARAEFLKTRTPEARAQQAEQRLQQERQQWQQQAETQAVAQFTQNYLTPRIESLLQQNNTVTQYELIGRWNELMAPIMVGGKVPASKLANVQSLVDGELAHWAQGIHLERTAETAKREKALKALETEKIKAKRQVARAIAPPNGAPETAPPKQEQFKTAKDWYRKSFGVTD